MQWQSLQFLNPSTTFPRRKLDSRTGNQRNKIAVRDGDHTAGRRWTWEGERETSNVF